MCNDDYASTLPCLYVFFLGEHYEKYSWPVLKHRLGIPVVFFCSIALASIYGVHTHKDVNGLVEFLNLILFKLQFP